MNALLITGTDAAVGKTTLMMALAAYWHRYYSSRPLGLIKPVQCGGNDYELYARLFGSNQSPDEFSPLRFQQPLPPPIAAEREGRLVQLDQIWQPFEALLKQREFVLVESPGGLGAPLTHETTVADLAWDWRIPTVLVVPVQPGAIAQAVANAALARQARVHLKGIVLNCIQPCHLHELEDWAPIGLVQSLTQKPVLGCMPHLSNPTDLTKLAQVAANLDLERLIPLV